MKNKERWIELGARIAIAILVLLLIYIGTVWKSM